MAPSAGGYRIGHVLILALALRTVVPLVGAAVARPHPQFREPDSFGYVQNAEALARQGSFVRDGEAEIIRTPGYPLFLVPAVWAEPWLGSVEAAAVTLQIVVGCVTVYFVYALGMAVFQRRDVAAAGATLMACEPLSVLYCSKLLTEALFACTLSATLLCLTRFLRNRAWRPLCAAAAALAASIFVRPIGLFLPFIIAVLLLLVGWRGATSRRKLAAQALVFGALSIAPVAAWQVRNYVRTGYGRFSAISEINLYYYQAAAVLARQQGKPLDQMQRELGYSDSQVYFRLHPEQRDWTPGERYAFLRQQALRIIRHDPAAMFQIHLAGMRGTLFDVGTSAFVGFFGLDRWRRSETVPDGNAPASYHARLRRALRDRPVETLLHGFLRISLMGYLGCAALGLAAGESRRNPAAWLVVGLTAYLLLLSGGPAAYHRFRLPMVPVISLFAGMGFVTALHFVGGFVAARLRRREDM